MIVVLLAATAVVFLICVAVGALVARRTPGTPWWLAALFVVSALPAICYVGYYLHLVDEPVMLYRLRALPGADLLAGAIGLPAGWLMTRLGSSASRVVRLSTVCLAIAPMLVVIPYAKPLTTPLNRDLLQARWQDDICLQSTASTCGPSSAATLLRAFGLPGDEATLAADAHTSATGTEIWYLARALRARGLTASFQLTEPNPKTLPYPAIAGTRLGDRGHFIAILGREGDQYIIGDPLTGRELLSASHIGRLRHFTGFFLRVERHG
jgi:hypothetical protein